MPRKNDFILSALHVVAYIIFIGLCIESGVLLFNFVRTLLDPCKGFTTIARFGELDSIRDQNGAYHPYLFSFAIVISLLKAFLFFLIIKLTSKLNLIKPFSQEIYKRIDNISLYTLSIGLVSAIAYYYVNYMNHNRLEALNIGEFESDAKAFIMMAAIIYVIAKIFERGLELQSENELTV